MANGSYGYESSGDGSPEWDESLSQRSMASGEFHPHFRNACHTVLHIGPSRYGSKFLEVASLGSNRNLADDDEEAVANSSPCVCRGDNRGRVRQTPQRGTALGVHRHILDLGTSLLSHFQSASSYELPSRSARSLAAFASFHPRWNSLSLLADHRAWDRILYMLCGASARSLDGHGSANLVHWVLLSFHSGTGDTAPPAPTGEPSTSRRMHPISKRARFYGVILI